ncbi:MAG TPA: type II secretion system protein [Candidatus Hydrogenedentes bacterium]|nr:type II secretion system protein [Candidatus Hydrogenedentota bacterium]
MTVCGRSRHKVRGRGFSLVEIIVALAVISIAGTVFVSMYMSSMDLARTARNRTIAARLAEEQLNTILRSPAQFHWNIPQTPTMDPFSITAGESKDSRTNTLGLPSVMPLNQNAFNREETLYNNFRWTAQGRFPALNSAYCEVTLVVHWAEAGRPKMLALTSALPRFQLPDGGSNP